MHKAVVVVYVLVAIPPSPTRINNMEWKWVQGALPYISIITNNISFLYGWCTQGDERRNMMRESWKGEKDRIGLTMN